MWPFKKKEDDYSVQFDPEKFRISEMRNFRGLGEKFNYLGIEMIVIDHTYLDYTFSGSVYPMIKPIARLSAQYVNKNGIIEKIHFDYHQLDALRNENNNQ